MEQIEYIRTGKDIQINDLVLCIRDYPVPALPPVDLEKQVRELEEHYGVVNSIYTVRRIHGERGIVISKDYSDLWLDIDRFVHVVPLTIVKTGVGLNLPHIVTLEDLEAICSVPFPKKHLYDAASTNLYKKHVAYWKIFAINEWNSTCPQL